jgi:hypothetical protein
MGVLRLAQNLININYPLHDNFIDDVLCTALDAREGGSWHWVDKIVINEVSKEFWLNCKYEAVSKGGTLNIIVTDTEGNDEVYSLTKEKFLNGFIQWHNWRIKSKQDPCFDPAMIDANDADLILQFALFGEEKYS